MVVILAISPILIAMGTAVVAVLLGWSLDADAVARHQGSELLDTNY